eukprot:RCo004217
MPSVRGPVLVVLLLVSMVGTCIGARAPLGGRECKYLSTCNCWFSGRWADARSANECMSACSVASSWCKAFTFDTNTQQCLLSFRDCTGSHALSHQYCGRCTDTNTTTEAAAAEPSKDNAFTFQK